MSLFRWGAIPVLVDIELETFTMDPADFRRKLSPNTKAFMPVHAFGCSADMDPLLSIAEEMSIAVVEDAATALGATYYDRPCGGLGTLGCFSFHPRKVITTGEGGMIVTDDDRLGDRISLLRNHGGVLDGFFYRYEAAGFNYRLSDIQGAIGGVQMRKLSKIIKKRRALATELSDLLMNQDAIRLPKNPPWGGHIFQSFVILLDDKLSREFIIGRLRESGIEATIGTYALHDQPFFQRTYTYASGDLPNSHTAFMRSLTLPLYPQMLKEELEAVAHSLDSAISAA